MSLYCKLVSTAVFGLTIAGGVVFAHPHEESKPVKNKQEVSAKTKDSDYKSAEQPEPVASNTDTEDTSEKEVLEVAPLDPIYLTGTQKNDKLSEEEAVKKSSVEKQTDKTKIDVKPDKLLDIVETKSKKGINSWIVKAPGIGVVSVNITFKNSGSKADPDAKKGLAEIASGMLTEGAGDMDSQAFKHHLLRKNIKLVAVTGKDNFTISFRCTKENLADAFDVVKLMLTKPRFANEDFSRFKKQMQVALSQLMQSENVIAKDKMVELIYSNDHPYRVQTADKLRDLDKLSRDDLVKFVKGHFAQDNVVIGAAGDINEAEFNDYIDKTLSSLPIKAKEFKTPEVILHSLGALKISKIDSPQSHIMFLQKGVKRSSPDFYALLLLNHAFGGGAQNCRLWEELREKTGLVYFIWSHLIYSDHVQLLGGATATSNLKAAKAIGILREQWQKLADNGLTEEELKAAKKQVIDKYVLSIDNTRNIAATLVHLQLDELGKDYPNTRTAKINGVTLDDISRVAKQYIKPKELTFVLVGQPEGIKEIDIAKADDKEIEKTQAKKTKTGAGAAKVDTEKVKSDKTGESATQNKTATDENSAKDAENQQASAPDARSVSPDEKTPKQTAADAAKEASQKKLLKATSSVLTEPVTGKESATDIYNQLMDEPKDLSNSKKAASQSQPK